MQEQIQELTIASQQGKLPSSTENNPKTLHAVTLRSGLILPEREREAVVEQKEKKAVVEQAEEIEPVQKGSSSYDLSIDQFLGATGSQRMPTGYLAQQYGSKINTARASKATSNDSFRASTSTQPAPVAISSQPSRTREQPKEKST